MFVAHSVALPMSVEGEGGAAFWSQGHLVLHMITHHDGEGGWAAGEC